MNSILQYIYSLLGSIRKDVKRLFSSKVSGGLLLLGPLLMIFLVGFAFQGNQLSGVGVGVYSEAPNVTNAVVAMIEENDFNVTQYSSKDVCVQDNKDGKTDICLSLLRDDGKIIADVNLDFSRTQLSSLVLSEIKTIFDDLKTSQLTEFGSQLREGAESTRDSIQDLETGLKELQGGLTETQQRILNQTKNMSLGVEGKTLGDIPEIQNRIQQISTDLEDTESYLRNVDGTVEENIEALVEQREEAEALFSQYGCSGSYQDIQSGETEEIVQLLQTSEAPECMLIYNYMEYFDERIEVLNEIETGVEDQRSSVQDYHLSVSNVSETPTTEVVGDEIDEIKTQQQEAAKNVSDGLGSIVEDLDEALADVGQFKDSPLLSALDSADESIDPVSLRVNRYRELRAATMLDLLFPGILTTLASFVGILVGSVLTMKERTSSAGFRNTISPISTTFLQFSATLTGSILCASQVFIVLIIGKVLFGIASAFTVGLLPFLFFSGAVFTILGQLIGTFSPNEEVSTLLSITTAVVFLLFSSMIIPLEKMHPILAGIFSFSPFNLTMDALRQILIFSAGIGDILVPVGILAAYFVTGVAILIISKEV